MVCSCGSSPLGFTLQASIIVEENNAGMEETIETVESLETAVVKEDHTGDITCLSRECSVEGYL